MGAGKRWAPPGCGAQFRPALAVATAIQAEGAVVRVHDPVAIDNAHKLYPTLDYAQDVEEALGRSDIVVHATEWREYRALGPGGLRTLVR